VKRREEEESGSGTIAGTSLAPIHAQKKGKLETTSMVVETQRRRRMKRRKTEN